MELLFEGNLNDPLWMNTVPFSGFNSTCRFAPAGFCCGGLLRDPLGGIPATEIISRPSLRAGGI